MLFARNTTTNIHHSMNSTYRKLSGIKLLAASYTFKFLFIAFLGIHIPLIGLIILILAKPEWVRAGTVFLLTLLLTLGATGCTLYILNGLLSPLKLSKKALEDYLKDRKIPNLPMGYHDEAGVLMSKVQETVTSLDTLLEEKKDLIGLLSHDLRTPLASILLLAESLRQIKNISDEERGEIAEMILDSTKEQMALFEKVLDILRNDDINRFHLELTDVPVSKMLAASVNDIQPLANQKNIQINVVCPSHYEVPADDKLISQVIKNLLSNAVKFSYPDSSIQVEVEHAKDRIRINVSDAGLGFRKEDCEKLFHRFTSARKPGTQNEVSTGMGLYLSSKIVKAHQGQLSADSQGPERGATFTLELPYAA
jgi:signal transduction histidine kinase